MIALGDNVKGEILREFGAGNLDQTINEVQIKDDLAGAGGVGVLLLLLMMTPDRARCRQRLSILLWFDVKQVIVPQRLSFHVRQRLPMLMTQVIEQAIVSCPNGIRPQRLNSATTATSSRKNNAPLRGG